MSMTFEELSAVQVESPTAPVGDLMAPTSNVEGLVAQRIDSPRWQEINELEKVMATMPQQLCPLRHIFTPGLYTRTIFMPAGTILTSRIHLYEHPFIISMGVAKVRDDEGEWKTFTAPHIGVTKPGTRRVLEIVEDTLWTTFHVTNETDPEKIVEQITYDHMRLGHMDAVPPEQMAAIRHNQKGQV